MLFSWRRLSAGKRVALLAATAVARRGRRVCPAGGIPVHSRHLAVSDRHHRLYRSHRARRNRHPRSARQGRREPLSARGDVARRRPDLHRFQLPDHGLESRRDRDLRLSARGDDRPSVRRDLRADEALSSIRPFPIKNAARLAAGSVVEFDGRRSNGEVFPVEASFSRWQGTDGFQFGAILRDISVRKREAERIRYLAEHDTLTGLINRNTLHAQLEAKIATAEAERPQGGAAGDRHRRLPADQRHARSYQRRSRASRHFAAIDGGNSAGRSGRSLERRRIRHRSSDQRHRRKRQPLRRTDRRRLRRASAGRQPPPPRQGQHRRRRLAPAMDERRTNF